MQSEIKEYPEPVFTKAQKYHFVAKRFQNIHEVDLIGGAVLVAEINGTEAN